MLHWTRLALAACCLLWLNAASGARTSVSIITRQAGHHHHEHEGSPDHSRHPDLCTTEVRYRIGDPKVTPRRDGLTMGELKAILETVDKTKISHVNVRIIGLPCATYGCCEQSILVRPKTTDVRVLEHAVSEYRGFLDKLQPHFKLDSILDAGGNIGIATVVFANLWPTATIVVLEPQEQNCLMAKANTLAFPNVRVHCEGLWDKVTRVAVKAHSAREDWAWRLEEAGPDDTDSVPTTTIPDLLTLHGLQGFDFVKSDVEGAEFKAFGKDANCSWAENTQLVAMEIHDWLGTRSDILQQFTSRGFHQSKSGEYVVLARDDLHSRLSSS